MDDSLPDLDEVVHQRVRLSILTICSEARRIEFSYLQESLDLTPGNLSTHLRVLEEAGAITIDKTFELRRAKTWITLTRAGRQALRQEIAALRVIVERVESTSTTRTLTTAKKASLLGERPATSS